MPNGRRSAPGQLTRAIAALLESERLQQGLPQAALASSSGVSQSQLSKLLRGERVLTIETLDALCASLGLDIVEVIREAKRS